MGKELKTSDIVTGAAMPIKKGTLDFLQAAFNEPVEDILKALIGFSSGFVVLHGCVNTGGTLPTETATISAGSIFDTATGKLYRVPAASFVIQASEAIVGNIVETNYTNAAEADPVTFTNGAAHNVHIIKTIVFTSETAGSGDVDYSDLEFVYKKGSYTPTLEAFDSSNVSLGTITGFTGNIFYSYNLFERNLALSVRLLDVDTPANTNYIRISLPITIPTGKTIFGSAYVDMYIPAGSIYNSNAYIELSSTGAGDAFEVRKLIKTDYGALTSASIIFAINMRII